MRKGFLFVAILLLFGPGCVPMDQARRPNTIGISYHPAPPPEKDKALIYVYLSTDLASSRQAVYIGDRSMGTLQASKSVIGGDYYCEYTYAYVPPMKIITIAAKNPGRPRRAIRNNAVSGHTYYYVITELNTHHSLKTTVRIRQMRDDLELQNCHFRASQAFPRKSP